MLRPQKLVSRALQQNGLLLQFCSLKEKRRLPPKLESGVFLGLHRRTEKQKYPANGLSKQQCDIA